MALVPSYIKKLASYKPGKPLEEVRRELGLTDLIKLASNENSLGSSPMALQAVTNSLEHNHRYPDAVGYNLRSRLAERFNLKLENVILGAGSEGIMSTIMRTFLLTEDEVISADGSFIGFRVLCNATGRKAHWVPMKDYRYDLKAMTEKINDYTKIIYIANPDNPMGTYVTRKQFDEFYRMIPERVLIILDEAYYEFTTGLDDFPDSMTYRYDNVITLRTFSKAYGLAGFRIGYGFAHENLISNLMKVKVPFEPSFPAQVAGFAAIDDTEFLENTLRITEDGMRFITGWFDRLGITYIPSVTNFITTIWENEKEATGICNDMLAEGVILRHLGAFGWPNAVRISIGLKKENEVFIERLEKVLSNQRG